VIAMIDIIKNIFHVNSTLRGLKLIFIDHICECIATPMIILDVIKDINTYPI